MTDKLTPEMLRAVAKLCDGPEARLMHSAADAWEAERTALLRVKKQADRYVDGSMDDLVEALKDYEKEFGDD